MFTDQERGHWDVPVYIVSRAKPLTKKRCLYPEYDVKLSTTAVSVTVYYSRSVMMRRRKKGVESENVMMKEYELIQSCMTQ